MMFLAAAVAAVSLIEARVVLAQTVRGPDWAAVEAEIRQYLERLKYRDALAEYLASLRARAEVRRLGLPE